MAFGDEVGVFENIPDAVYHGHKIPSNSSLKLFGQLPALYEIEYLNSPPDLGMTEAKQLGKVFEIYVLEPHRVDQILTISTKGYDTKEADSMAAMFPDKVIISAHHLPNVKRWAECMLKKYPLNANTKKQVSAIVDIKVGEKVVRVKFRMDEVDFEKRVIIDYKLMEDVSEEKFSKAVWDYGYDMQNAMYCKGMDVLFPGPTPWKFLFRVQEKHNYGFDDRFTTKYWLDQASIDRAWSHISMQLQILSGTTEFRGYREGCLSTERFKWGRG